MTKVIKIPWLIFICVFSLIYSPLAYIIEKSISKIDKWLLNQQRKI